MKHFLLILFFSSLAFAHDADRACEPGEIPEDGCRPLLPGLGFLDPLFFAATKDYRHCRRLLVADDTVSFAKCRGATSELYAQLGEAEPVDAEGDAFLAYWKVIPAHPELDEPGNTVRALSQLAACELGRKRAGELIAQCELTRYYLSWKLGIELNRVCPVCPKQRRRR